MTVRIRLARHGRKKRPFYRLVVADSRSPRDGKFIEMIGTYNPLTDPADVRVDEERAMYWLKVGAQPSETARSLLRKVGVWDKFMESKKV
jgi:small subunit ribosomal protein S16